MEISIYNTLMYPIPMCRHLLSLPPAPHTGSLASALSIYFVHLFSPSQEAQPLPSAPVYLHRKSHTQSLEHLHQKYQEHY